MGFRQEYSSGSPRLPNPGIKPASLMSPALAGGFFTTGATWEAHILVLCLVTQLCLTVCDPMDCSPPGSSVHGILRQEYWSGLPFPSPGNIPDPGIEPRSPELQAHSLLTEL